MRGTIRLALVMLMASAILAGCSKEEKQRSRPRPDTQTKAADTGSEATQADSSGGDAASTALPPGHPPTGTPAMPPGHPPISTPASAAPATPIESGPVSVAGLTLTPPEGWNAEQPANQMRAAQYVLPGDTGPAELVVFYFGVGQGGGAAANIDRWVGQFKNPDDASAPAKSERGEAERNGLKITWVRVDGMYAPSPMGPMAPKQDALQDAAMLGYVIEDAPGGSVFIKATGPAATIDAQKPAIEAFVASARAS